MNRIILHICIYTIVIMVLGCVEEVNFENETFEDVLVIDAVITNEEVYQEIRLGRTYRFEDEDEFHPETNATVVVVGDGIAYQFKEMEAGLYRSVTPFAAQPNVMYHLEITTYGGKRYTSSTTQLTSVAQIDRVYAVRELNSNDQDGVAIYLDALDPNGDSNYYRYEYEETYKIIPPLFVEEDLIKVSDFPDCEVAFTERDQQKRICYRTDFSSNINLANSELLNEDRITRHLIRFVSNENYIISHRYSILVKQFVQTKAAHEYFKAVTGFTSEGSIFSRLQGGYIQGNIKSISDPKEKVIGYFEASSVTKDRIFFNYTDLFPGEPLPPYRYRCNPDAPNQIHDNGRECGRLIRGIDLNFLIYWKPNLGEIEDGGPYLMVRRACGDCTALGDPEIPEFWTE
ncbi:MAG: DUF4249 domain-containing protein [Bacteroidota bacterium]